MLIGWLRIYYHHSTAAAAASSTSTTEQTKHKHSPIQTAKLVIYNIRRRSHQICFSVHTASTVLVRTVSAGRGLQAARSDREVNRAIREWAKSKKLDVSDRGRIKQEIVDRYHAEAGR